MKGFRSSVSRREQFWVGAGAVSFQATADTQKHTQHSTFLCQITKYNLFIILIFYIPSTFIRCEKQKIIIHIRTVVRQKYVFLFISSSNKRKLFFWFFSFFRFVLFASMRRTSMVVWQSSGSTSCAFLL